MYVTLVRSSKHIYYTHFISQSHLFMFYMTITVTTVCAHTNREDVCRAIIVSIVADVLTAKSRRFGMREKMFVAFVTVFGDSNAINL